MRRRWFSQKHSGFRPLKLMRKSSSSISESILHAASRAAIAQ